MLEKNIIRFSVIVLCCLLAAPGLSSRASGQPSGRAPANDPDTLVITIPPVENVNVMYEKFLPLKEYLERSLSRKVLLKVARTNQDAVESIGSGQTHLAYLDPSAYCEARHRYRVIPLAKTIQSGAPVYRSVIVARKDARLSKIVEAKKKRLALGSVHSSSSYLIPAVMFKEVGIGLGDFSSVDYLEQEDRIALSVLARRHDLGGLSERVAAKYLNDGLKIIKTSEAIPQYTLCACPCLGEELRFRIQKALLAVDSAGAPGLLAAMRDIDGFAEAQDRDFDVVRVMLKNLTGKNYLEYDKNAVKVAILPLYSAITLFDRFDPLMRWLSVKTGYEFKLVIPRDFEDFFETVRRADVHFSYSNPYIYIQLADQGYARAFATTIMQTSGDIFRGVIITHKNSALSSLEVLRGKDVMVVSFKSAGGFLAQRLYLAEHGIDVFTDMKLREGKRQEEVILNVYRRTADAGFVRESALDVLREEIDLSRIKILATTPYIVNWPFAASQKTDDRLMAVMRDALLSVDDAAVLEAAQVTGFRAATDRDFDTLRTRIKKYESP